LTTCDTLLIEGRSDTQKPNIA